MKVQLPLPERAETFLREYEELCKKHGLMVLSDGESVEVGTYREDLWGIRVETMYMLSYDSERHAYEKDRALKYEASLKDGGLCTPS